ncbi:hypothetical protein GKZ68_12530 [Hymenobacter sp. BRD128]|uniref:hypothetical protein n=1 Tax=Hymenobacter sp. BRD128 TaxID=2675878 RepID=UPI001565AB2F|nr:hypothetical protein [Hymenobacter sp. BRD128]QKG57371.1 hypothetical protein GKZ68_12530 [Hymenobacter sp. BRD128]
MNFLRSLLEAALTMVVLLGLARWALGLFGKKATVYRATPARQLSLLTWPLLAVGTGLAAAGPGLVAPTAFERWLAWALLLAVLALAAPALLLHLRYYTLNAATTLVFNPLEGHLQVALDGVLAYDPARQGWPGPGPVAWSRCRWPGVFWRRYEYLRLPLPQGDIILTSLVLPDMHLLVRYLRHYGVEVQERRRAWAWL